MKGAEKRTDLELLSLKSAQLRNAVEIRWAHSEAHKQLHLFYRMGHKWRIVEDEERASARKRKLLGLEPLENRKSQGPEKEPETPWEPTELFLSWLFWFLAVLFLEVWENHVQGVASPSHKEKEDAGACCFVTALIGVDMPIP